MTARSEGRHLPTYVGLVHKGEETLAASLRQIAKGHAEEAEVVQVTEILARFHDEHVRRLRPIAERYGEEDVEEPERLHAEGLSSTREGPVGLLRDLQDVHLLATLVQTSWTLVHQAAMGARDDDLEQVASSCLQDVGRTLGWLMTHMKVSAPQALLVAG